VAAASDLSHRIRRATDAAGFKPSARQLGDEKTADLAASIRADEERALEQLPDAIPELAGNLLRAKVEGEQTYDPGGGRRRARSRAPGSEGSGCRPRRGRAEGRGRVLGEVQVQVVAPALHTSALRFWLSDADEAIARADEVLRETVDQLGHEGVAAAGDMGESDPLEAIEDARHDFEADRILVFTRPEADQRYREDVDESELSRRFGLPVERVVISGS
jgi:hypothetical protein